LYGAQILLIFGPMKSKKAYPWNNACIESFHALIKMEWINRFKILDYNHAYRLVFNYDESKGNLIENVGSFYSRY